MSVCDVQWAGALEREVWAGDKDLGLVSHEHDEVTQGVWEGL